jgi:hypothetical protein
MNTNSTQISTQSDDLVPVRLQLDLETVTKIKELKKIYESLGDYFSITELIKEAVEIKSLAHNNKFRTSEQVWF